MTQYKINNKEQLERFSSENWESINTYLDELSKGLPIPFYSSVDIRESLEKFAPVDNNLYPAGFNNICQLDLLVCGDRIKKAIDQRATHAKRVGIITESNTKNLFYLDHIATLSKLVEKNGYECDVISFDQTLFQESEIIELTSKSEFKVIVKKATISTDKTIQDSSNNNYDFIILNHDQSKPMEIDWSTIKTPIGPSPQAGWFKRQKTKHFEFYKEVAQKFCQKFSINPLLIQADFNIVNNVDFLEKKGLDALASEVRDLQERIGKDKTIFIKANQGTYGMGIMTVTSPEEVLSINRKIRNKMDVGKNKIKFSSVILQEGIETVLTHDGGPAEITIYLINGQSSGGFMRANPLKDSNSNLNSRGMLYQKFCISEITQGHDHKAKEAVYSIIARISTIASSYEINDIHGA